MAGELFVPGAILGTIGGICLFAGSVSVWIDYGAVGGLTAIVASMVLGLFLFFLEVRLMKTGRMGRWFFLNAISPQTPSQSAGGIPVGTKGKAVTRLNPTGLVMIGARRLEAISRDGMIDEGTEVEVVNDDPFRVVVKKAGK